MGAPYIYDISHLRVKVSKSRRIRWNGHIARRGDRRVAHGVLMGRSEKRRPLERRRRMGG